MHNFLQRECPTCGEQAVTIDNDGFSTRTCPNGHKWFPVKNPHGEPELVAPTPDPIPETVPEPAPSNEVDPSQTPTAAVPGMTTEETPPPPQEPNP